MAMTPEKKVKDAVTKILKQRGCYYFFPVTGGFGRSGIPDIICAYKGNFIAIECKANGNKPTALQEAEMDKIRNVGQSTAIWVDENCIRYVTELLDTIDNLRDIAERN